MIKRRDYREEIERWIESLPNKRRPQGEPIRGSIAAWIIVLEHLRNAWVLDIQEYLAEGGAQIRGVNPSAVHAVLSRYGETRPFLKEGGRTNRGAPGDTKLMIEFLRSLRIAETDRRGQDRLIGQFQGILVDKIKAYHDRQRLKISIDPNKTTWSIVHDILEQAKACRKDGPVAQYLVGAKLQLRFPEINVSNDRYCAGDAQTDRLGDFQ